ncbi:hypothetical protein ACFSCX_02025 [Bacillus salitolerans]|uniref:Uncharacterized protein n=1 Tax=Bacillus salitolerans TaxID=1437434 RepID=A0ABW4LJE0_9BACI
MNWKLIVCIILYVVAFYLQILGMMNLIPIYVSTPLFFIIILITLSMIINKKRFKGFKGF